MHKIYQVRVNTRSVHSCTNLSYKILHTFYAIQCEFSVLRWFFLSSLSVPFRFCLSFKLILIHFTEHRPTIIALAWISVLQSIYQLQPTMVLLHRIHNCSYIELAQSLKFNFFFFPLPKLKQQCYGMVFMFYAEKLCYLQNARTENGEKLFENHTTTRTAVTRL